MQSTMLGTALATHRLPVRSGALPDDGVIDVVKVARRLAGDLSAGELTSRERNAAVVLGTRRGLLESEIDTLLGMSPGFASKVRQRLGINVKTFHVPQVAQVRGSDRRTRRTLAGWRRNPVGQPLSLVYGLSAPHQSSNPHHYYH